jgi:hypothetical protein
MDKVTIAIEIDPARLASYADSYLATLWHVAQANPAPHGDHTAGELAESVGWEIIRRWLKAAPVELWHHQARDYYWSQLGKLATFQPGPGKPGGAAWHNGVWTPKPAEPAVDSAADGGGA